MAYGWIGWLVAGVMLVASPALANDTQAAATSALQAVSLVGSFTTQPTSDGTQNGLVISQAPLAGSTANQGSTVKVIIGAYTASSTTSTPSTTLPSTTSTSTTAPGLGGATQ